MNIEEYGAATVTVTLKHLRGLTAESAALAARCAALEERVDTLAECLESALDMIEDQFPAPDPYTASIVDPGRAALAAPPVSAATGEGV